MTTRCSAIYVSLLTVLAILSMVVVCGLVMYAYFRDCDPILAKRVDKPDQVIYSLCLYMYVSDTMNSIRLRACTVVLKLNL